MSTFEPLYWRTYRIRSTRSNEAIAAVLLGHCIVITMCVDNMLVLEIESLKAKVKMYKTMVCFFLGYKCITDD